MKQRIYAQRVDYNQRIQLHVVIDHDDGSRSIGLPLAIRRVEDDDLAMEGQPAITLRRDEGQQLIDALWDCGLRPSEGSGSAGQLASTQRHLEDMRAIAFAKTEVAKP